MEASGVHCDNCNSELVELSGEWYCPECDDVPDGRFRLDNDEYDFEL